jgi:hypothetical protein
MRCLMLVAAVWCLVGFCFAAEPQSGAFPSPTSDQHAPVPPGTPQVIFDLKLVKTIDSKERVLSNPQLVTVSGRTANFQVGNDLPPTLPPNVDKMVPPPGPRFVGTKANVMPTVLADGRIRADIRIRVSDSAGHVREVAVGYVFRDGETAVLPPDAAKSSDLKLIATASIVRDGQAKARTPPAR